MFNKSFTLLFLIFISTSILNTSTAQTNDSIQAKSFNFVIEQSVLNKSLWTQPYRFEDKSFKLLTVKIVIKHTSAKIESVNFDLFSLINESKKLRIRPTGVYYQKVNKKKYLKSKPVNENYNVFKEITLDGFENVEAKSYPINFWGMKKKNTKASVKSLKKRAIKGEKATYYLEFPVQEGFTYGKIYYNNKPVGFTAVK